MVQLGTTLKNAVGTTTAYSQDVEEALVQFFTSSGLGRFPIWESLDAAFGFYRALFPSLRTYGTNRLAQGLGNQCQAAGESSWLRKE